MNVWLVAPAVAAPTGPIVAVGATTSALSATDTPCVAAAANVPSSSCTLAEIVKSPFAPYTCVADPGLPLTVSMSPSPQLIVQPLIVSAPTSVADIASV